MNALPRDAYNDAINAFQFDPATRRVVLPLSDEMPIKVHAEAPEYLSVTFRKVAGPERGALRVVVVEATYNGRFDVYSKVIPPRDSGAIPATLPHPTVDKRDLNLSDVERPTWTFRRDYAPPAPDFLLSRAVEGKRRQMVIGDQYRDSSDHGMRVATAPITPAEPAPKVVPAPLGSRARKRQRKAATARRNA